MALNCTTGHAILHTALSLHSVESTELGNFFSWRAKCGKTKLFPGPIVR